MSKYLYVVFIILFISHLSYCETYTLGSKDKPATVEIKPQNNSLYITCTFKPQTKFSNDRNQRFNQTKADDLCQKGLLLYAGAHPGEKYDLSGISIEKSPVVNNGMVSYFFVKNIGSMQNTNAQPTMSPSKNTPVASHVSTTTDDTTAVTVVANTEVPSHQRKTVARNGKGELFVIKYEQENNQMKVVSSDNYRPSMFNNMQEFETFCEEQFSSIEAQAEKNRAEILKRFEQQKRTILNK